MAVESRYAVMKFRTFNFTQAAQLVEMNLNPCKQEVETLRRANELLRQKLGPVSGKNDASSQG